MNHRLLAAAAAMAAITGCSSGATIDESQGDSTATSTVAAPEIPATTTPSEPPSAPTESESVPTTTTTTTTTATTATTTTTTAAGSSTTMASVATSRSTITTDAGRIDAEYRAGELDVVVDANPGWTIDVERRGPAEVEVVWNADDASVHATVVADDTGISSTTRSVHSTT